MLFLLPARAYITHKIEKERGGAEKTAASVGRDQESAERRELAPSGA